MSTETVETAPVAEKAPRVKRTAAELKTARIEKAQARLDRVVKSGDKVTKRAADLAEKAQKAQSKADAHAEELRLAQASLAWEQARPVKGESALTDDEDDPFAEPADGQDTLFDLDDEDDEDEDTDEDDTDI
jgi:hypothetical protein